MITIITDRATRVPGEADGSRVRVEASHLEEATGWVLKARGLCRGDICVPVADRHALIEENLLDMAVFAQALGRRFVIAPEVAIAAVALDADERRRALEGLTAPDFSLPDLDGNIQRLSDSAGSKRLIVAFASWCGCRYDLPGWQSLHDELADEGLVVVPVALDDDPDDVRPFTTAISTRVLLDRQHVLSELYAVSNVPTVIWIDESGAIVRPNGLAFGTDTFVDFTGVASGPHFDAVRRWVRDEELPLDASEAAGAVADLNDDEIDARLHFRVGIEARRQGDAEVAEAHLRQAGMLAPMDFSVRRAAMPLLNEDPFGQAFLDLYEEWQAVGAPYHGLAALVEQSEPTVVDPDASR
jgi:peroxiredoxin